MLSKCLRLSIASLVALSLSASLLSARGQFWDFLGYTQVDSSQNHGRILVTRRDAHVRRIQLRVTGEAIFFDHLEIRFEDGTSQELMVSERILPGVRDFELLGGRSLKSVELWYYQQPEGHNPKVTLYGVRSPEDEGQTLAQSR
jgi:hypothetical protein